MTVRRTAAPFPIAAEIAGVAVVTIPAADYAELLQCRRRLAESEGRQRAFKRPPKSAIERDPAVAAFLAERFGGPFMRDILAGCAATFGKARTPSRSAAYRYWSRLRTTLPLNRRHPSRTLPAFP